LLVDQMLTRLESTPPRRRRPVKAHILDIGAQPRSV
jgi:hypothetical protein